jgi:MFS family permease
MVLKHVRSKGVGPELASVLPQDNIPWYKKSHLLRLNISLFCLILFASANGYDGSMMNGLQALPQWQEFMGHPTGAWLGFVNAVQALGGIFMYPVAAWSNNQFGRKKTVGIGYFWLVLGVGLQTGASSPAVFVVGRLFVGCGGAFFSGSCPILMTEIAYPTHRSIVTALYNCGWYVGKLWNPLWFQVTTLTHA